LAEFLENFDKYVNDFTDCRMYNYILPIKCVLGVVVSTHMTEVIHRVRALESLKFMSQFRIGGNRLNIDDPCFDMHGAVGLGIICNGVRKNSESSTCECATTGALVLSEEHHAQQMDRGRFVRPHETDKYLILFYDRSETGVLIVALHKPTLKKRMQSFLSDWPPNLYATLLCVAVAAILGPVSEFLPAKIMECRSIIISCAFGVTYDILTQAWP
jgi:hypothetical protein